MAVFGTSFTQFCQLGALGQVHAVKAACSLSGPPALLADVRPTVPEIVAFLDALARAVS